MFALYVFALAIAALCAAATTRMLFVAGQRRVGNRALLREAEPEIGSRYPKISAQPSGSLNVDKARRADFMAAADIMNTPQLALIKRFFDILFSLALIIFLGPILIIAAIAIKLDSPGPILYRQRRVGFRGQEFKVFKFRSMIHGAEPNGPQYAAINDN